jgi:hypothetical protein
MAFFGLTTLGASDPIYDGTGASQDWPFHLHSDEAYVELFNKYLIGSDSSIALTLEIDGDTSVLRASLGDMLRELLQRKARKFELEAWVSGREHM